MNGNRCLAGKGRENIDLEWCKTSCFRRTQEQDSIDRVACDEWITIDRAQTKFGIERTTERKAEIAGNIMRDDRLMMEQGMTNDRGIVERERLVKDSAEGRVIKPRLGIQL